MGHSGADGGPVVLAQVRRSRSRATMIEFVNPDAHLGPPPPPNTVLVPAWPAKRRRAPFCQQRGGSRRRATNKPQRRVACPCAKREAPQASEASPLPPLYLTRKSARGCCFSREFRVIRADTLFVRSNHSMSELKSSTPSRSPRSTHSHSMVPGGFDVTSSTTRLTPGTSLVMRLEMRASTSYGRRVQSAVIASSDETGRRTMGCP